MERDIPRERLDVEIKIEVESDVDTEVLTALVKGANDGVETGLDFDLGGSGADLLDGVLWVSNSQGRSQR
jgi:hypothetical protein